MREVFRRGSQAVRERATVPRSARVREKAAGWSQERERVRKGETGRGARERGGMERDGVGRSKIETEHPPQRI